MSVSSEEPDCDCGKNQGEFYFCAGCELVMCEACWNDLYEDHEGQPLCDACMPPAAEELCDGCGKECEGLVLVSKISKFLCETCLTLI